MILETLPDVQRLPSEKKLRLIEELWDDLGVSVNEDQFPILPEHLQSAGAALVDREAGTPWATLREALANRGK